MSKLGTRTVVIAGAILVTADGVWAGGEGGSGRGEVGSLIAPLVNFALFAGILYWLLQARVKEYFFRRSQAVAMLYREAQEKQRAAEAKLAQCQAKMQNMAVETAQILAQIEEDARAFEGQHQQEIQAKVAKLRDNIKHRLQAEESALVRELHGELLESVLLKTKDSFAGSPALQSRAWANVTKGLH